MSEMRLAFDFHPAKARPFAWPSPAHESHRQQWGYLNTSLIAVLATLREP
jgi:hypothetical protein